MFAWVTRRSFPSLERIADLSPSLEQKADLSPSFERQVGLCHQSKITHLILSFKVPCGSMNIFFGSRIFCLWLVIETHILPFFSGNLLILSANGNMSFYPQAINYLFLFPVKPLCWCYLATALNLQSLSSPAKLVYYIYPPTFLREYCKDESVHFVQCNILCVRICICMKRICLSTEWNKIFSTKYFKNYSLWSTSVPRREQIETM